MADENMNVPENTETNTPVELTPVEQKAAEQGWVPKEQWEGDPDNWRPAKEFLDRGELFKKIEDQNRTIKQFKTALDQLAKHHEKVKEVEYQRALDTLKAQKKEALVEGDADAVIDIDEKIAMVRDAAKQAVAPAVTEVPQENIVFNNWVERNGWYNTNQAMRAFADHLGNQLGAQGGMSPSDILSRVEQEVKKEFAHKFTNPNRDKPGAVEGGGSRTGKTKDTFVLDDVERRVMRNFLRSVPGMTEEKYIADLKKIKGV